LPVALNARALITLAEYKLLSKDPAVPAGEQPTEMDDYYTSLINQITGIYRQYCRLPHVYEEFEDEEHDGTGKAGSIWLRNYPVVAPAGAVTLTVEEDSGSGLIALTLNTDFKLRKLNGELIRISSTERTYWASGIMNVVATYTAGRWATTAAVADDMKMLAVEGVNWIHGMGPAVWGSMMEGGTFIKPDAIPRAIKLGLSHYARQVGG
jgi:hypothetical protein